MSNSIKSSRLSSWYQSFVHWVSKRLARRKILNLQGVCDDCAHELVLLGQDNGILQVHLDEAKDALYRIGLVCRNVIERSQAPDSIFLDCPTARLKRLEALAATGTIKSMMELPDESKRELFALLIQESLRRKKAEKALEELQSLTKEPRTYS